MYRMIRIILQYDMIHKICILYCMIHEHLRYADTIRNFYTRYDTDRTICNTYRMILTTMSIRPSHNTQLVNVLYITLSFFLFLF